METSQKPYGLTVYYEPLSNDTPDSKLAAYSRTNALVVFCMIDNLDEITFAYRISQSNGKLDASKYDTTFTFQRNSLEKEYGDLTELGKDLSALGEILAALTK